MPIDNNLPVAVDGGVQAIIGTDIYSFVGGTAHAQVMKVAWGNDATVTRATNDTPLPVRVFGLTGSLATVTVTGSVRGLGTFNVGNTSGSAIHVTGGVNAFIYGVTGATPVAVTGSVNISSSVGITGIVNVTGGRYLNSSTDSVTVGGTVSRNWNLTNATDNIKIYAPDGGQTFSIRIVGAGGNVIGSSGDALNVNLVNAGLSASVTFSGIIQVTNSTGTVLRVEGTANGTPVPVSGTVAISNSSINIGNTILPVDILTSSLSFAGTPAFPPVAKNVEKLFTFYEGNVAYTIPWYLRDLRNDVGWVGSTGSLAQRLNELVTNGSSNRQAPFVGVRTFNATRNPIKTWRMSLNSTTAVVLDDGNSTNVRHGVTIKNISTQYSVMIGSGVQLTGNPVWQAPTQNINFGIHLSPLESIFIPSAIFISFLVADGFPPLYGKIVESGISSTQILSIMAV